jgi:hemerythrin-like domain-containing protein
VLYPAVEAAMQAPGATATMSRDHADVRRRIDELARELARRGRVDAARAARLRRLLCGLNAVVSRHFEKEEEIYLEILDAALAPDEADALSRRLEEAAG